LLCYSNGGVLNALSAFAILNATLLVNASASASVRMYALWYPSTNFGQDAVVANSGATIGGQFAVRVVVQPNSGSIITASVIHQSITEQTNAHPVSAGQLAGFEVASPNPQYGDPTQNVVVLQSPFVNLAGHNGTYQIQVTVRYVTGPIPFHYGVYEETATMTLTMSNLVLVDSRAEPYFVWKPLEVAPPPQPLNVPEDPIAVGPTVPFSVQIQHAQSGVCTLRLEIFSSDNNQTPVLVKEFTNVPRPGVWQWEWDGRLADGSTAPRGIYLYRLSAEARVPTLPDRDSNRSDFLQLTTGLLELVQDNGEQATYRLHYSLTSSENRPASEAHLVVFDPELNIVHSHSLSSNQLTPGQHCLEFTMPSPEESGRYVFLLMATDNHHDIDKAHRRRKAKPENAQKAYSAIIAFVNSDVGQSQAGYFWEGCKKMGFKRLKGFAWWYGNPDIGQMRRALEYIDPATGSKPLKAVLFSGHSGAQFAGKLLLLRGENKPPDQASQHSQKWLVTCYADWYAISGLRGWQDCLILESIGGRGYTLTNLHLVLLVGCELDTGVQAGGLSDWFLWKGAKVVITIGYLAVHSNAVCVFLDGWERTNEPKSPGFMELLKNHTIHEAYMTAREATRNWAETAYGGLIWARGQFDVEFQGDPTLRLLP